MPHFANGDDDILGVVVEILYSVFLHEWSQVQTSFKDLPLCWFIGVLYKVSDAEVPLEVMQRWKAELEEALLERGSEREDSERRVHNCTVIENFNVM